MTRTVPVIGLLLLLCVTGCEQSWGPLDNPYDSKAIIQPPEVTVGTGSAPNSLSLATTFPGGSIHYSFDGTDPTADSLTYTQPIYLSPGIHTLKAVVVKAGYADSLVTKKEVSVSATISTIAGSAASGYSGDGGKATSALLNNPTGMVVEAGNLLLFSDQNNGRIRRLDLSTEVIDTYAGGGNVNPDGAFGPGVGWGPGQAFVDGGSVYYVSDGQRIFSIDKATQIFKRIAGPDSGGIQGYAGDGGPATSAQFKGISGLAVSPTGELWLSDSGNQRIRKIAKDGTVTTVGGTGTSGYGGNDGPATSAQVSSPSGGLFDVDGSFLFCDQQNRRIQRISPAGTMSTAADLNWHDGTPDPSQVVTNMPLNSNNLDAPMLIVRGPQGDLYFVSNWGSRVAQWNRADNTVSIIVNKLGANGYSGDGGNALTATIQNAWGLAFDSLGRMYIGDSGNSTIRRVDPAGTATYTIVSPTFAVGGTAVASSYTAGSPFQVAVATTTAGASLFTTWDSTVPTSASTVYSTALTMGLGTCYLRAVASLGSEVSPDTPIKLRVDPTIKALVTSGNVSGGSRGMALDGSNNLYYSTLTTIKKVPVGSTSSTTPTTIVTVTHGNARDLAITGTTLWDISGDVIEKRSLSTPGTVAATSSATNGFLDGALVSARFNAPAGLAIEPSTGDVWVADTNNHRIRRIHGTTVSTVAGTGTAAADVTLSGTATSTALNQPYGGVFLPNGEYWFVDEGSGGTLRAITPSTGQIRSVAGLGGMQNGNGNPFDSPAGIVAGTANSGFGTAMAVDAQGNLAISWSTGILFYHAASNLIFPLSHNPGGAASGNNGPLSAALFNSIDSLAFDANGKLYIFDGSAPEIRVTQ